MVSVEVPSEWYLVVGEGLRGREGEQARRLPVWELGWCRVLGERLREPRMSELGLEGGVGGGAQRVVPGGGGGSAREGGGAGSEVAWVGAGVVSGAGRDV